MATRAIPEEHTLLLEVTDQGVGLAPEHLARLCDSFFTTKAAAGGTGLGLAITATLVRAHGGRLTFQSAPGQGTCVYVSACLRLIPPWRQPQPPALGRVCSPLTAAALGCCQEQWFSGSLLRKSDYVPMSPSGAGRMPCACRCVRAL